MEGREAGCGAGGAKGREDASAAYATEDGWSGARACRRGGRVESYFRQAASERGSGRRAAMISAQPP